MGLGVRREPVALVQLGLEIRRSRRRRRSPRARSRSRASPPAAARRSPGPAGSRAAGARWRCRAPPTAGGARRRRCGCRRRSSSRISSGRASLGLDVAERGEHLDAGRAGSGWRDAVCSMPTIDGPPIQPRMWTTLRTTYQRRSASQGASRSGLLWHCSAIASASRRRLRRCWLSASTRMSHSTPWSPRPRARATNSTTSSIVLLVELLGRGRDRDRLEQFLREALERPVRAARTCLSSSSASRASSHAPRDTESRSRRGRKPPSSTRSVFVGPGAEIGAHDRERGGDRPDVVLRVELRQEALALLGRQRLELVVAGLDLDREIADRPVVRSPGARRAPRSRSRPRSPTLPRPPARSRWLATARDHRPRSIRPARRRCRSRPARRRRRRGRAGPPRAA